jgi:hypothetical protein
MESEINCDLIFSSSFGRNDSGLVDWRLTCKRVLGEGVKRISGGHSRGDAPNAAGQIKCVLHGDIGRCVAVILWL